MNNNECPFGHNKNLFALFYPNPTPGKESSHPMPYCIRCKKFLYELEHVKSKFNAKAVKKCAVHFV